MSQQGAERWLACNLFALAGDVPVCVDEFGSHGHREYVCYSCASSCLDRFRGLLSVVCRYGESYAWCEVDWMGI